MPSPERLVNALLSDDFNELRQLSASGELAQVLPEWARLTGPGNIQHGFHDFPLDEHTLRVVERTKLSPYYRLLDPAEKRMVTMAALLHDIDKETGHHDEREAITPDRQHPLKSARAVLGILPRLGFSLRETAQVAVLVKYHQVFGSMIIITPDDQPPAEEILHRAARALKNRSMLRMVRALSEGDIRGVKAKDALFSEEVAEKLRWFSDLVEERLRR